MYYFAAENADDRNRVSKRDRRTTTVKCCSVIAYYYLLLLLLQLLHTLGAVNVVVAVLLVLRPYPPIVPSPSESVF